MNQEIKNTYSIIDIILIEIPKKLIRKTLEFFDRLNSGGNPKTVVTIKIRTEITLVDSVLIH